MKMNKLSNIFTLIVILVIIALFGIIKNSHISEASSINPSGQCGEGPTGSVLFKDFVKVVGEMDGYPYTVNVCKYHNVGGLTYTAQQFCYLPEVINGWYRIWLHKVNSNGDYVCWIDWNVEGHWNEPTPMRFRGSN
jgi:hypothetical protein